MWGCILKSDAELQVLDRDIILKTQAGLPLVAEPYQQIAAELDIDTELLMQRIRIMQDDGRIRRIGAVPNHYRLGHTIAGIAQPVMVCPSGMYPMRRCMSWGK